MIRSKLKLKQSYTFEDLEVKTYLTRLIIQPLCMIKHA